jgi:hypothetical protein
MTERSLAIGIFLFGLSVSSNAQAQQTDVAATIQGLLTAFGTAPWTHNIDDQSQRLVCHGGTPGHGGGEGGGDPICNWQTLHNVHPATQQVGLTANNIQIVASEDVVFDSTTKTSLPNEITASGAVWYNCSASVTANETEALSVAFQRSSSIAINHAFTHTNGKSMQLQWKPYETVTVSGTVTITDASTSGKTDTNSYQQTITRTHTSSVAVPPRKAVAVALRTWPVKYAATFHTVATVDADLSANDSFQRLSQILGADKRTFKISGAIDFSDAADAQLIASDVKFDPAVCPGGNAGLIKKPFEPKLIKLLHLGPKLMAID